MADDGAAQFLKLSKGLKKAGKKELRKELHAHMRKAVKPLIPKTRKNALAKLPSKGGLAKQVAKAPQRVQVRTGESTFGVRLVVARSRSGARAANRGTIRHPVFGNRDVWVEQPVPPDWFDGPIRADEPAVKREMEAGMQAVAEKVVREMR